MTIQWTVYDASTGEILRTGEAMTTAQALLQGNSPGTKVVTVGTDPVNQQVNVSNPGAPTISPRPPLAANGVQTTASKTTISANGVDNVVINPIPAGATYKIDVPANLGIDPLPLGTVNDGNLVLTTTVPGAYTVTIKSGTSLDFTVTINAA